LEVKRTEILISVELHMNIVDSNDSGNAGAAPVSSPSHEALWPGWSLPDSNDEKENDAQLLFDWDLDAPQELNRP
jgi:hypothetical protein